MYDAEVVILLPNQALVSSVELSWMLSSCPNLNKRFGKSHVTQIQLKLKTKCVRKSYINWIVILREIPTNVVHTSIMHLSC